MIKKLIKFDLNLLGAIVIALLFFIGASSYNFITQREDLVRWNSPDETANYYFAKLYATSGDLAVFEPASLIAEDLVRPRSLRSDHGWLKPVSFLGIILIYGSIASLTSLEVLPYLTPFFGAVGIIVFYLLLSRLFSRRIALMSAFLLATFPVYLYYSVRSMFHNVLFIVLGLTAFYFLILALDKSYSNFKWSGFFKWTAPAKLWLGWLFIFLAGIFFGLTTITRSSELLWLAPVLALIFVFYLRRIGLLRLPVFFAGVFLGLLPALYYNQILYSSPWSGGYGEMNKTLADISAVSVEFVSHAVQTKTSAYKEVYDKIFNYIFFFGFHPGQSLEMFRYYVLDMFPWLAGLSALGLFGLITLNFPKPKRKYLVYVLVWASLSAILILYYGSWRFSDNPSGSHTIGNSYTRYWLPIYLMAIPLAAVTIELVLKVFFFLFRKRTIYRVLVSGSAAIIVFLLAFNSLNYLLFGSEEGLVYLYDNMQTDRAIGRLVLDNTPDNAVIMTQYHDKVFFPERKIIMGIASEEPYYPLLSKLLKYYPVYYFNFSFTPAAVDYLNNGRLAKYDLRIDLIEQTGSKFSLYKISKIIKTDDK